MFGVVIVIKRLKICQKLKNFLSPKNLLKTIIALFKLNKH